MDNSQNSLFLSKLGEQIYKRAQNTLDEYGMSDILRRGVLVGFSGGADSVLLLHFLLEYKRRNFDFPIVAVHVNHMIRGAEAYRDQEFSQKMCEELCVEFVSVSVDVPTMASEQSVGIEEMARNARYSKFDEIISGRDDIGCVAVAHNATDNLETIIFNMMRGAGTHGISGIAPVRDNILRPLIDIDKPSIIKLLDGCGVPYVTDSTNLSVEYTRNFIRNKIVSPLREMFSDPERSASRLSRAVRMDDDYILSRAKKFIDEHPVLYASELLELHRAVFARVIKLLASRCSSSPEEIHLKGIYEHLSGGDFSLSLPSGVTFVCERGVCRFRSDTDPLEYEYFYRILPGCNELADYGSVFILSSEKIDKISLNVYKNSIQADLSSAIIVGELYLRPKKDGDTVFYGGHTHKLKKIFNDYKIPVSLRSSIPLLCDDKGIVWVPGLAVREDRPRNESEAPCFAAIGIGKGGYLPEKRMRTISEYRINAPSRENNK